MKVSFRQFFLTLVVCAIFTVFGVLIYTNENSHEVTIYDESLSNSYVEMAEVLSCSDNIDIFVSITQDESWEDGSLSNKKYNVDIKNNSSMPIYDWSLVIDVGENSQMIECSDCKVKLRDDTLEIIPEEQNLVIQSSDSMQLVIVLASDKKLNSYKLIANGKEYMKNEECIEDNELSVDIYEEPSIDNENE